MNDTYQNRRQREFINKCLKEQVDMAVELEDLLYGLAGFESHDDFESIKDYIKHVKMVAFSKSKCVNILQGRLKDLIGRHKVDDRMESYKYNHTKILLDFISSMAGRTCKIKIEDDDE